MNLKVEKTPLEGLLVMAPSISRMPGVIYAKRTKGKSTYISGWLAILSRITSPTRFVVC